MQSAWALFVLVALTAGNPLVKPRADEDYRLGNDFEPTEYELDITLPTDLNAKELKFDGTVTIHIERKTDNAKLLRLHCAKEIIFVEAFIDGDKIADAEKWKCNAKTEILEIELENPKKNFILKLKYKGDIYDDMYGIYISKLTKTKSILTTQFQPAFARRAFPCFDEPRFKAKFQITLTFDKTYKAVSNQPKLPPVGTFADEDTKTQTVTFGQTPKMSTYLVAFAVSEFKVTHVEVGDTSTSTTTEITSTSTTTKPITVTTTLKTTSTTTEKNSRQKRNLKYNILGFKEDGDLPENSSTKPETTTTSTEPETTTTSIKPETTTTSTKPETTTTSTEPETTTTSTKPETTTTSTKPETTTTSTEPETTTTSTKPETTTTSTKPETTTTSTEPETTTTSTKPETTTTSTKPETTTTSTEPETTTTSTKPETTTTSTEPETTTTSTKPETTTTSTKPETTTTSTKPETTTTSTKPETTTTSTKPETTTTSTEPETTTTSTKPETTTTSTKPETTTTSTKPETTTTSTKPETTPETTPTKTTPTATTPETTPDPEPTFTMDIWSQKPKDAEFAAEVSYQIIKNLGEKLKIPYQTMGLGHLDQVAIPDFAAGAMENWGLVTFRESLLLWNKEDSKVKDKERVAAVIAHEFAHSWFGNLVTTEWWDTTWLNEGFARFFEYHGLVDLPETKPYDLQNQFVVNEIHSILETDGNEGALPLTSPVETVPEIQAKFGTITYSKGGSIVRMLAKLVGDKVFYDSLTSYLENNIGKSSTPEILFGAFPDNIDGSTIAEIMKEWTENAGYPVVMATLSEDKKTISVEQKQFYYKKPKDAKDTTWKVPISTLVISEDNKQRSEDGTADDPSENKSLFKILKGSKMDLSLEVKEGDTIILNPENVGYYRVNYDEELWKRIIDLLKKHHESIEPIVRAQLIDDAMNLARAGYIQYSTAMDLLAYLEKETHYYPWRAALTALSYLRKRLVNDPLRDTLTELMGKAMDKFYKEYKDFTEIPETPIKVYAQILALEWACELDGNDCKKDAKEQFDKLFPVETPTRAGSETTPEPEPKPTPIDPNLRSIVYCSGLRHSKSDNGEDTKNWDKLWEKYVSSNVVNEKLTILTALGCTTNPDKLDEYLQESIKGKNIRKQDANTVFKAVLTGNPEGVDIALKFLTDEGNWDGIKNQYGAMGALSSILIQTADRITTTEQLEKFKDFVTERRKDLGEAVTVVDNAMTAAEANMQWTEEKKKELSEYLEKKPGGGNGGVTMGVTGFVSLMVCLMVNRLL